MLEQRSAREKGYITLKEAAAISDYSADYIGQLIRAGKIEGQQVYSNVAWVTTEESLQSYMSAKNKKAHTTPDEGNLADVAENFGVYALYTLVAVCTVFALLLFYILSVSIDRFISERFAESVATLEEPDLVVIYE